MTSLRISPLFCCYLYIEIYKIKKKGTNKENTCINIQVSIIAIFFSGFLLGLNTSQKN